MSNLQDALGMNSKELEQFSHICQELFSHNFILRTHFLKDGEKQYRNPDYLFLQRHNENISDYFALMGYKIIEDIQYGYFYLFAESGGNRLHLTKDQTALFLCLRLIYEEKMSDIGVEQDVTLTIQEILDKLIQNFEISKTYSKQKTKDDLAVAQHYRLVQKIKGAMNSADAVLVIYPSILTAVPAERIHALVEELENLEKEEES